MKVTRIPERLRPLIDAQLATLGAHLIEPTVCLIRRYEHAAPGELVHVDIRQLGRIPTGGGSKHLDARRPVTEGEGNAYIHSAVEDHRPAYSEVRRAKRAETAVGFWCCAQAWFAKRGARVRQVLTDNGPAYRARVFAQACAATDVSQRWIRPYRPKTNGMVERINRTLLDEWAYVRVYRPEQARTAALADWIHQYNHRHGHSALGGRPRSAV